VSRRRAVGVIAGSLGVLLLHVVLVRAMAHGHVAHVLLGSGNAAPPLGASLLAISLVLVRLTAVVLVPGALLAAVVSLVAQRLGSGITSGAGRRSEAEGSGAGAGAIIDGRGTR